MVELISTPLPFSSITNQFFVLVGTFLVVFYLQFLWGRRKLYKYALQVDGPFSFPFIGSALHFLTTRNIMEVLMEMAEKYIGIIRVWFGPKLFYGIWDPEYIEILLNSPHALAKGELYDLLKPAVGEGVFAAKVPIWMKHRRIINAHMKHQALDKYINGDLEQMEKVVKSIKNQLSNGTDYIDLDEFISGCTINTICETIMGQQLKPNKNYGRMIVRSMDILYIRAYIIFYHSDFIFNFTKLSKEVYGYITHVQGMINDIINTKRKELQQNSSENDVPNKGYRKLMLESLLDSYTDSTDEINHTQIRDEMMTFLIAGSDTTTTTVCFVMMILGMYPDVQQTVYDEIIDVIGTNDKIEIKDLIKLKYLERVIKETMRLFPLAPIIARTLEKDLDLKDGKILPAGAGVIVFILYLHRHAKYWPNPMKFDPDRFLSENLSKRHRCTFIPFSYGPRNCPGITFGMVGVKAIVSSLIRSFKVRTDYKRIEDVDLNINIILRPKNGYKLHLENRS